MKKVLSKKIFLAVFAVLLCVCIGCLISLNSSNTTTAFAKGYTQTEVGINDISAIDYATFASNASVTHETEDEGFIMEKGASTRINVNTPGIRFKANLGASIDNIKASSTYSEENYTYEYYLKFTSSNASSKYANGMYVKATPRAESAGGYSFTGSLAFGSNLSTEQFNTVKAYDVTGSAVIVLTPKTEGSKIVVEATTNDSSRNMEAVANAAILAGDTAGYTQDIQAAIQKFVGNDTVTYGKENQLYYSKGREKVSDDCVAITADANATVTAEMNGATIEAAYWGAKKLDASCVSGNTVTIPAEFFTDIDFGTYYLCVKGSDGAFRNYPLTVCTKTISQSSDLVYVRPRPAISLDGYYVVTNDITSTSYKPNPAGGGMFIGTFDGNGYTVNLHLLQCGLFANLQQEAVVKDVNFVVKGTTYSEANNYAYPVLANAISGTNNNRPVKIENVNVKYDIDNFTPTKLEGNGLGLVLGSVKYCSFKNVTVDMSGVKGIADLITANTVSSYGVFGYTYTEGATPKFTDCKVIWDVPQVGYVQSSGSLTKVYFAENDSENAAYTSLAEDKRALLTGVTRVSAPVIMIDNEITDAITLNIQEDKTLTVTSPETTDITVVNMSGNDLVDIDRTTISYTKGKVGTADIKITAVVNGIAFDKIVRIEVSVPQIQGRILYSTLDNTATYRGITGTVTKIVSTSNEDTVYYDKDNGGYSTTTIPQADTTAVLGNAAVAPTPFDVYVYVDGALYGQAEMASYAKVISKDTDLAALGSSGDKYGYWMLANDIIYNADTYQYHNVNIDSNFYGLFDGNGYTIEFANGKDGTSNSEHGLFYAVANGAVIKNLGVTLKGTQETGIDVGKYSLLGAGTTGNTNTIENIYGKYDCTVDFIADSYRIVSAGFFAEYTKNLNLINYKNCILDLSNVQIPVATDSNYIALNIFGGRGPSDGSAVRNWLGVKNSRNSTGFNLILPTQTNYGAVSSVAATSSVIQYAVYAANDTEAFTTASQNMYSCVLNTWPEIFEKSGVANIDFDNISNIQAVVQLPYLQRFENYAAMNTACSGASCGYKITDTGISWNGSHV